MALLSVSRSLRLICSSWLCMEELTDERLDEMFTKLPGKKLV